MELECIDWDVCVCRRLITVSEQLWVWWEGPGMQTEGLSMCVTLLTVWDSVSENSKFAIPGNYEYICQSRGKNVILFNSFNWPWISIQACGTCLLCLSLSCGQSSWTWRLMSTVLASRTLCNRGHVSVLSRSGVPAMCGSWGLEMWWARLRRWTLRSIWC